MTQNWGNVEWIMFINYLVIAFLLGVIVTWIIWRKTIAGLEEQLNKAKGDTEAHRLNKVQLLREIDNLKQTLDEQAATGSDRSSELREHAVAYEQLSAEASVLKDQISKLKSENEAKNKTIDDFQAQIIALNRGGTEVVELVELRKRLNELQAENMLLKAGDLSDSVTASVASIKSEDDATPDSSSIVFEAGNAVDDLKKIEGIGPKIEQHLNDGGIENFAALANSTVEELQLILDNAGPHYSMHDPSTWPQQASLAANGEWHKLKSLQDELNAGRRK